jgi:hypothetical protein
MHESVMRTGPPNERPRFDRAAAALNAGAGWPAGHGWETAGLEGHHMGHSWKLVIRATGRPSAATVEGWRNQLSGVLWGLDAADPAPREWTLVAEAHGDDRLRDASLYALPGLLTRAQAARRSWEDFASGGLDPETGEADPAAPTPEEWAGSVELATRWARLGPGGRVEFLDEEQGRAEGRPSDRERET